MFGLHDTESGLWIGNQDGPFTYEDAEIAQVAAMIVDRSLKQPTGRTRALPISPRLVRLRDEKAVLIDPVTALKQLEEGQ